MAFNVRVPDLTGDYKKDKVLIENYMKEANLKIRLLEELLRKEIKANGKENI